MLFAGEDGVKKVRVISVVRKCAVCFKADETGANVLLLDEPTDHLDMESNYSTEQRTCEIPGSAPLLLT